MSEAPLFLTGSTLLLGVIALEATQAQMDGLFSQLPYICHVRRGGICGRLT